MKTFDKNIGYVFEVYFVLRLHSVVQLLQADGPIRVFIFYGGRKKDLSEKS